MLARGRRGLGFAVGAEPLSSFFASCEVDVVATDAPPKKSLFGWMRKEQNVWLNSGQYAESADAVFRPELVDKKVFQRKVLFRHADMRRLPDDLGESGFDFLWSSCAFEHLGSIQAGLDFVENSLRFLKPGGLAIHTTEYNVSSNTKTIMKGGYVIYRRKDLEELGFSVRKQNSYMEPLDFDAGTHKHDLHFDVPPYNQSNNLHIKLKLDDHICTSALLVIRKG